MTPEQKQRIEQIQKKREQQRNRPMLAVEGVAWDDVDFLLSLVKSQEAEFNSNYEGLMRAALLREQNAAASMRSACVEKVRVMKVDYRDRAKVADSEQDNIAQLILLHKATAANEIINALESLSIEKPKE